MKTILELCTASSIDRTIECPGWARLALTLPPERQKPYADKGTASHKVAEKAIINNTPLLEIKDEAARIYVAEVRQDFPGPYIVEARLPLLGTSGGIDCYALDEPNKTAYLWDYKAGAGVRRVVRNDGQIGFYACAIRKKHPWVTKVIAKIVQPNMSGDFSGIPNITTITLVWQSLAAWEREIGEALDNAQVGASLNAGDGSHCQFCPNIAACPAYRGLAESMAAKEDLTLPPLETITTEEIASIAKTLLSEGRVKKWYASAFELLLTLSDMGHEIPGFERAKKRTNRIWNPILDESEIAQALVERGMKEVWQEKLIPLTRAEKEVDIEDLVEKPIGAWTIRAIKEK